MLGLTIKFALCDQAGLGPRGLTRLPSTIFKNLGHVTNMLQVRAWTRNVRGKNAWTGQVRCYREGKERANEKEDDRNLLFAKMLSQAPLSPQMNISEHVGLVECPQLRTVAYQWVIYICRISFLFFFLVSLFLFSISFFPCPSTIQHPLPDTYTQIHRYPLYLL